jgi:hypothetical protein
MSNKTEPPAPCVTHHPACACRERAFRALLEEEISCHRNPDSGSYNGCDEFPCLWCELARGLLAGITSPAEILHELQVQD